MSSTAARTPIPSAPKSDANGAPSGAFQPGAAPSPMAATQDFLRQSVAAKENAILLVSQVQGVVGLAENAVREQLRERPYLTLGAAAGVGYVLAGGLASPLTKQLMRAGAKAATTYLASIVLTTLQDQGQDPK